MLVRSTTIASKMGAYTQSRVQFEPNADKRQAIGEPPMVDAADPTGTHIGTWSIVGHDADTLQEPITEALEHPEQFGLEYQDDEYFAAFVVDIPIRTAFHREAITRTVKRSLQDRNMRVTRQAVSVMQAFCGSVHDVALFYLGSEDYERSVGVDDLKFGLSYLEPTRILPESPGSTQSRVVHALIASAVPLSQTELCDRAGVSQASFAGWGESTSHRDILEAFGIISKSPQGWVVCLSYSEADVDDNVDGLPWYAIVDETSGDRKQTAGRLQEASLQGALYEAMLCLEPPAHFSDVDHPVTGTLYGRLTTEDLQQLVDHRPSWRALVCAIVAFRENDPVSIGIQSIDVEVLTLDSQTTNAVIGKSPDQMALTK